MPHARNGRAEIYYECFGPQGGPALVFAHGAGGNTLSWFQQVPHFAARQRVIVFDHRCFGRSRCPSEDFHPREFPGDLLAILDGEGIERAWLVCQSMGGWTGLRTARDHPERVRGLVLCGTPGGVMVPEVVAAVASIGQVASSEGIRGNAALAPDYPGRRPEMAHLYDAISGLNDVDPALLLPRMFDADARIAPESLAGYGVPTWVISGEHDQLFPPASLRAAAAAIPGATLVDFPGSGHSTYFERPDHFNALVEDMLATAPDEGGAR